LTVAVLIFFVALVRATLLLGLAGLPALALSVLSGLTALLSLSRLTGLTALLALSELIALLTFLFHIVCHKKHSPGKARKLPRF
jgi:hypothetical protein